MRTFGSILRTTSSMIASSTFDRIFAVQMLSTSDDSFQWGARVRDSLRSTCLWELPAAASLRSALGTSDTSEDDRFRVRLGIGRTAYLTYVCYSMPERYMDGEPFSRLECG